jgi:hypothetical protein
VFPTFRPGFLNIGSSCPSLVVFGPTANEGRMTTFVLANGSWHRAWCWDRLIPELQRRGHTARTADLPFDDPTATTQTLVDIVNARIDDPAGTVLVAHSAAGVVGPVVAQHRPIRELVMLAAMIPLTGHSYREQVTVAPGALRPTFAQRQAEQPTSELGGVRWKADDAYEIFYGDCPRPDADLAIGQLRPRNAVGPFIERTPFTGGPTVPTRYVVCTEDRVFDAGYAIEAARVRLHARIREIEASHSPFWSRPADLAALLVEGLPESDGV